MASKRQSREKKKVIRRKQKVNRAKKVAFLRSVINRSFDDLKPIIPTIPYPTDNYEFILADTRYNQMIQESHRRSVLFRKF